METVNWKQFRDWPYEVSDTGLVRRMETKHVLYQTKCGFRNDYLGVDIYHGSARSRKRFKVHRMVAELFLEKPQDKRRREVHHIDGDPINNRVDNLEWCTRWENEQRKIFMDAVEELSGT